jgi:DNA-nicking Smr family endonuclease
MSDDSSFLSAMGDVTPLKKTQNDSQYFGRLDKTDKSLRRNNAQFNDMFNQNMFSTESIDYVDKDDVLAFKKDGVQDGVYKNVRLGKYQVDSTLNLHGQSVKEARIKLFEFLQDCYKHNVRSLLIQHGKGLHSEHAVLKSYVNVWLRNVDFLLAFHSAQPQHGGTGAVYALLKKSEDARIENRERHQKRQG